METNKVTLEGLFPGKGQRIEDLIPLNQVLTPEQIEENLNDLVRRGEVEPYSSGGQNFYMLSV